MRLRLALIILIASAFQTGFTGQIVKKSLIRQADYLLINVSDPQRFFTFFTETLQLPIAWPMTENQGYLSGGFSTGNVSYQFFRYTEKEAPAASRFSGIAFEPNQLDETLQELQSLRIPYSPPEQSISTLPNGTKGVLYTTVDLPAFSKSNMSVFLYRYSPEFLNVAIRRRLWKNSLMLNNGGPLGILSTSEIVIASTNPKKDKAAWEILLGKSAQPDVLNAGDGLAIRMVKGNDTHITEVVFTVKSLDKAKKYLKMNGLLGSTSAKAVSLLPSKFEGLKFSFVE
jgi:hypothetical protein